MVEVSGHIATRTVTMKELDVSWKTKKSFFRILSSQSTRIQRWRTWLHLFGTLLTSFAGKEYVGPNEIFASLTDLRSTLAGDWPPEKLVHVVEKLQCKGHGQDGIAIRASGSFIIGNQFLICGDGVQAEGLPNFKDQSFDLESRKV
ncbi:mitogen-activated protein kinase kinase 3-like [Impatiens glandulifera]|uniref:mitogen-activated protein kinase kinase 3-like n=1 Tax=Impatiens glandulifera TaxID=253017 RepID=UPI001FB18471|nr:mitogen-activated protein kinase kinase 3-like [Impatiens glandulifera]